LSDPDAGDRQVRVVIPWDGRKSPPDDERERLERERRAARDW
jgi:hypothetical protein